MKIFKNLAYLGLAKRLFDEARKPENQRRIKSAVDSVRARRAQGARRP